MTQPLIVFWSWQSDHPAKIAQNFVKDAFVAAVNLKGQSQDISFDSRPDEIELDHDTKGLLGPVDILDEIKKKIDACDHYLADITPVGRTDSGKALPNPNVMIELGYALKTKSIDQITFIANSRYYKGVKDLPFDISKRRQPLCYHLSPKSKDEKIHAEKYKFAKTLLPAIQSVKPLKDVQTQLLTNAFEDENKFTFLRNDSRELIGFSRSNERRFKIPRQPFPFLKIAPTYQIRPLMNKELNPDAQGMSMFVGIGNGGDWIREYDGWTTVETVRNIPSTLISITKIFMKTGLIWNLDYSNSRDKANERYLGDMLDHSLFDVSSGTYTDLTYVPEHWYRYLSKALEAYKHLGIEGPFDIQAGMFIRMPLNVRYNVGHMYKMTGSSSQFMTNQVINSDKNCVNIISKLFEALLDAAAYEGNFPPQNLAKSVGVEY